MSFELDVLGCSGTYPVPGNAATGFLVRSEDSKIWIDAGTGTFANLQKHADYRTLDAVLLSHLHLDHILDLFPLYYALRYSVEKLAPTKIKVFAPEGTESSLGAFVSKAHDPFGDYLVFGPIGDGSIAGIDFTFVRARHPVPTYAMRIEHDGKSLGYTADTAPSDAVTALMKGVDILIAEATMQAPDELMVAVHMTAREAGEMASRAGARRLLLTHIWPGLDPDVSVAMASERFSGEVAALHEGMTLRV